LITVEIQIFHFIHPSQNVHIQISLNFAELKSVRTLILPPSFHTFMALWCAPYARQMQRNETWIWLPDPPTNSRAPHFTF